MQAETVIPLSVHFTDDMETAMERLASMTWALRLKQASTTDIKTCSECSAVVEVIACIEDSVVIDKMTLTHLNEKALSV